MKRLIVCGCLLVALVHGASAQDGQSPPTPPAPSPPSSAPASQPPASSSSEPSIPSPQPDTSAAQPSTSAAQPASSTDARPTAPSSQPGAPASQPSATVIQTSETSPKTNKILVPHDLSPWSMFLSADVIVKAVMIGLACASLMTWTIFFGKILEFGLARRRLRRGLRRLEGKSFAEAKLALGKRDGALKSFFVVAERELGLAERRMWDSNANQRCESELADLVRVEVQSMRRGMSILATIGSTAPFVGLFGTVWGIMNSFIGISKSQTTNLAVVAPGIAEALLATAVGLVAAIPAVIIYNHFTQSGRRYQHLIVKASGTVQRMLSREIDRRLAVTKSAE